MSIAKDERQSTETLSFRCWRERCRLTRGAVVKQRQNDFVNNRKCAFTLAEGATHVALFTDKRRSAFTLAEVLITLGIIGIVAALTLPTLINKYQEKATITKVKKFYSLLSQGYQFTASEHGTPDNWGMSDSMKMQDLLLKNVKVVKHCDNVDNFSDCYVSSYKYLSGQIAQLNSHIGVAKLADGTSVMTSITSSNCPQIRGTSKMLKNICGLVYVDINGKNPPNTAGKDLFSFYLTKYGIVPLGTQEEFLSWWPFEDKDGGLGVTAWIIINENMDYFRCWDKLGWDKASSCK